jgi:hypothetical protein
MTCKIQVAYRPKQKLASDVAIKSEINLAAEEKPKLNDATLKKDTTDIVQVETELKDEKNLLVSGQKFYVTYKYGVGKDAVDQTVTGTIADPKGVSYLAIDI